ncbi:hypothetical protein B0H11DRAFT_1999084 [Mycena galericulata]|nr:hypothetical protein B0H11DRAFT_1999084 [Mycena galericulata]
MSDQAAAEALVAVGRSRVSAASSPHGSPGHPHPTDDDGEDAPRRKRARRKAPAAVNAEEETREREREREEREREQQQRDRERDRDRKRAWFPGAHHSGPFDLPPLERAFPPFPSAGTPGGGGGPGAGYMRSASAGSGSVPSRHGAGSPAGGVSAGPGYTLPPVRTGYYGGGSAHDGGMGAPGPAPVPTVEELERHYFQLHEQRRKTEELLRETDRVMAGLKRGLDEMRAGTDGGAGANGVGSGAPEMVPLRERERGRSRENAGGASVWPVSNDASRE